MLNVKVKYFGPLIEADIALRPLTVFIGENNAGKSYIALLNYAIFASFGSSRRLYRFGSFRPIYLPSRSELDEQEQRELNDLLEKRKEVCFDELPNVIQNDVDKGFKQLCEQLPEQLTREIQRCFGSELSDLIRPKCRKRFELIIESKQSDLRLEFKFQDGGLALHNASYSLTGIKFPLSSLRPVPEDLPYPVLINSLVQHYFQDLLEIPYYFPAARSGILQSHKALAGIMVSRLPLVGIEPIEIPRLTGVVADFISNLITLETRPRIGTRSRKSSSLSEIAAFLEQEVSRGTIDVDQPVSGAEYPEFVYEANGNRFPIHRTSSMVSEIAPIVLFLKYIIRPQNLLIIEEPEAHLHPENQRILARAISQMVNAGLHVLVTTHSDYFLQQLSNCIRMSSKPSAARKLGYTKKDQLPSDSVGAYLFSFRKNRPGAETKELPVSKNEGIPEDAFVQIAESIYDETVKLDD